MARRWGAQLPVPTVSLPLQNCGGTIAGATALRLPIGSAFPALSAGGVFSSSWWRSGVSYLTEPSDFTRPRPLIQLKAAAVLARLACSRGGLTAAAPTARAGIQHHPSWPASDCGIGSLLHLESQPADQWPPYQTSAGTPELALDRRTSEQQQP